MHVSVVRSRYVEPLFVQLHKNASFVSESPLGCSLYRKHNSDCSTDYKSDEDTRGQGVTFRLQVCSCIVSMGCWSLFETTRSTRVVETLGVPEKAERRKR